MRKLAAPLFLALVELDIVMVIGVVEPEAMAAGEEAREIFARLGAKQLLEMIESVLGPSAEPQRVPESSRLG
jgi:hypothetical protein